MELQITLPAGEPRLRMCLLHQEAVDGVVVDLEGHLGAVARAAADLVEEAPVAAEDAVALPVVAVVAAVEEVSAAVLADQVVAAQLAAGCKCRGSGGRSAGDGGEQYTHGAHRIVSQ